MRDDVNYGFNDGIELPRTISQTTHEKIAADTAKAVVNQLIENHNRTVVPALIEAQGPYTVESNTTPYFSEAALELEATAAITQLKYLRGHVHELGERVLRFRRVNISQGCCDVGECRANLTLAFRHLEDARMRLGKAIQAIDGGVSVFDK